MRQILAPILLLIFLFPTLALGGEVRLEDLVERGGLYFPKFSEVPFTGKVTGKQQGSFKDGKRDGPYFSYGDNGQLYEKGTYKDGKKLGLWVRYHQNGQLWDKGTYKDGKEEGYWVRYHENGRLWWKVTYKDGELDGRWVSYNKDGTMNKIYSGTWRDGVRVYD